jgi:LacI family transcriptional regulator
MSQTRTDSRRPSAPRGPYRGKAVRLAHTIEQEIVRGRWEAGQFLPPETELADTYGVARLTIRRSLVLLEGRRLLRRIPHQGLVVNGQDGSDAVAPAVRRRSVPPPSLTVRGRVAIAAVCAAAPDEGANRIQAGIEDYCREHGFDLQLMSSIDDPDRPFSIMEQVERLGVQGIIVLPYPGAEHREVLEGLHARGFPLVCVERRSADLQVPSVEVDNRTGMYRAVQHLLTTYRRPVWYLGMTSSHRTDSDRYEGYRRAMRDAGYASLVADHTVLHEMDTADPRYWHVDDPWQQGYEVALRLFSRGDAHLSVACQKDNVAWGLYKAAAERGLVIGRQVMVTGFDDLDVATRLEPQLTTVRQSFHEKGYKAAWLLHRRLTGALDTAIQVTIPVELVTRASA